MKKAIIIFFTLLIPSFLFTQTMYVGGQIDGDWGAMHQMNTETLDAKEYFYYTIEATSDYTDAKFLFQSDSYYNRWNGVTTNVDEVRTYIWHDNHGGDDNVIDSDVTDGNHYTFRLENNGYSDSKGLVMETSDAPITISSVNQIGDDIEGTHYLNSNEDQTINIGISGSKSTEEKIYLRYTTDSWSTDNFVEASGSGVDYSATIPGQINGTDVEYYVLTTTLSYSVNNDLDNYTDLVTIKYNNNSNNYSYTVDNYKTYHTISIDGTNDFSMTNERFETSTSNYYSYFTWDSDNLYFSISGEDVDLDNRTFMIYIDTDPHYNPENGNGTKSSDAWGVTHTLPFKADYFYVYKTQSGDDYVNLRKYNAGWQADQTCNGSQTLGSNFLEMSLPLNDIGNPSQIYFVMFRQDSTDPWWTGSATPSNAITDGNGSKTFQHYLGYTLETGIIPNEVVEDPTLPVVLSTFTAQYLNSKPTLYWTTQSETDNMGWFVYRNKIEDFTSATKVSGMIEGHGTTTQAQSYIFEDVIADPQVGDVYYYWLESVDYSGTIHHFDKVAMITIPDINNPNPNVTPPQVYDLISSPNPFNESTKISFTLTQSAMVDVAIYDVKGALVKSFDTQHVTANDEVLLKWYGNDENSKSLSNGIYLYSVKVNGQEYSTKQVILMK